MSRGSKNLCHVPNDRAPPRCVPVEAKRSLPTANPGYVEPCHPAERDRPPSGGNWIDEIKADGYRAQVHLRDGEATVYSRRGYDWTETFASMASAAETLPVGHAVLDGEAIVQDAKGVADYHALRRELARKRSGNLTYYAFDLLYLNRKDLRQEPLLKRKQKQKLNTLIASRPRFLLADHLEAEGEEVFALACRMGLQGIVSKRTDSPYRSGRQESWIKAKMHQERHLSDHCLC